MYSVLTIDIFSLHRQPAGASAQRTTKRSTCHGLKVEWDTVHAVGAYVADPSDVEPSSCQRLLFAAAYSERCMISLYFVDVIARLMDLSHTPL